MHTYVVVWFSFHKIICFWSDVSNLIPHCKRWCSWGRHWVWWDAVAAAGLLGTCFPWCVGWTYLCVGSRVPSYLSEHTEAMWHWQSPRWSAQVSAWGKRACWWIQIAPWHSGITFSQTTTFDLMGHRAKTKTRGILISDSAFFDDTALLCFYAITLSSWTRSQSIIGMRRA